MSLALRFLPTLGMETKAIIDAQSARGGSVETGSFVVRIKAMVAVVVPVFGRSHPSRRQLEPRLGRALL